MGTAFTAVHAARPALWHDLFHTDGFHPSPIGSYLEALVIYATIFGVLPLAAVSMPDDPAQLWARARVMQPAGTPPLRLPTTEEMRYLRIVAASVCAVPAFDQPEQLAAASDQAKRVAAEKALAKIQTVPVAEDKPLKYGAAESEPKTALGDQEKKDAEAQLRAAMPFWLQTADSAKLGPAIEAAKKAGVAALTVATAEAKLTEALSKAAKAAEEKARKEAEGVTKAKAADAKLKEVEDKAKRAAAFRAAEQARKQAGTEAKEVTTAATEDDYGDAPLTYKDVAPGEKAAVAAVAQQSGYDYYEDEPPNTDAKSGAAVGGTAVAFLGNSILYYNDTPRLIESLGSGSVEQNSCLRGGVTFEQLLSKGNGMDVKFVSEDKGAPDVASLLSRSWHYIVMNDYTQAPAREESRRASVEVLKTQMAPLLEQCGGTPVLLETWAYRAHTKGSDDLGDHAEFTSRLQEG